VVLLDEFAKVDKLDEKFIRSVVDVKSDETVEIRPEGVVVRHAGQPKPPVSLSEMCFEAMQMTRDREMDGARAFYKAHREKRNNG